MGWAGISNPRSKHRKKGLRRLGGNLAITPVLRRDYSIQEIQQMKVETKPIVIGLDCYLTWSFARSFRGREEAAMTAYCENL